MADTKISGLPASTVPLAGTEVLPIVQSSTTKQVSVANLTAGRAVDTLNLSTSGSTSTTPVLGFNASNCNIASGATVASTYLQAVMQNKSGTANASTNWAVSNDLGTDSSYYGEFGMNSSVFSASTPADFFSINNDIYFSGHDGDISIGSGNGYKTYLVWGTTGQSAHVINATGALGFSTNLGTTPALSGTTGFGTSGQALISAGSAAAPAWGTLGVAGGGTGLATLTANYIPYGNGTSAFQSSANLQFTGTNLLLNQSYDQGTGVLQVTGNVTNNGTVVDKSLNLQGGNNLLTYSQDFTNAAWAKNSGGGSTTPVITTGTLAPDGTSTANSISFGATSTNSTYSLLDQVYTSTATTYARSIFVKATTAGDVGKTLYFYYFNGTASADIKSIVLTSSYQRIQSSFTVLANASSQIIFGAIGVTYGGSNQTAFSVDVWGAQLELGSVASAYTPTTTTAVTTTNNISVPSGSVIQSKPFATIASAPTIASGSTIAVTTNIAFISGTTTINTITAPTPLTSGGGQLTLIPTGLFLTGVSGNIALASASVVSKALIMTYDSTTAKWYPSY